MADAPTLSLLGVCKTYPGAATPAVADLTLHVARGEFVSIVGGSGSGKTTLLKLLNRLIEPDSGEARLDGQATTAEPPHLLRRRIGYVFQGVGLFSHMSVAENVAITPRLLGWPATEIDAQVDMLLRLVELPPEEFRDRSPAMLSGGQRQRVGVARALAARPSVVLMDEPFGALDALTRGALAEAYLTLHRRFGLTTVMVTHDLNEALAMSDRIGVMQAGRLVAVGAPEALARADADPYVRDLLAAPRALARRIAAILDDPGERAR